MLTILLILMISGTGLEDTGPIKTVKQWETPPEDHNDYLQDPADLDFDSKGRLYVLDVASKRIFVWEADGSFKSSHGKEGNGPGEFVFTRNRRNGTTSNGSGSLSIAKDVVHIYDRRKQEIMLFDDQMKFLNSFPFRPARTRIENLWYIGEQENTPLFMARKRTLIEKDFTYQVILIDAQSKVHKTLTTTKDETRKLKGAPPPPGQRGRLNFSTTAYGPTMTTELDNVSNRIIMGYSNEPIFTVYDIASGNQKTITCQLPLVDVTDEDKKEYTQRNNGQQRSDRPVIFPEKKAYYDNILPLKDDRYFLYQLSPVQGHVQGYVVDAQGTSKRRVSYELGEGGKLFGKSQRVLAIINDENGDFILKELAL